MNKEIPLRHNQSISTLQFYWPVLPVRVWTRGRKRARPARAPAASDDPPGSSPSHRWAHSGWSTSSRGHLVLGNRVWHSLRTPPASPWEKKSNESRSIYMCYNNTKCRANEDENTDTSDCPVIRDISNIVIAGFSDISLLQEEERWYYGSKR